MPETPDIAAPLVPDHELLAGSGGRGSYGQVWLARNRLGNLRAVKLAYRSSFDNDRPSRREFQGSPPTWRMSTKPGRNGGLLLLRNGAR